LVVAADVSRHRRLQKVIDLTLQTFRRIDALINNAGVISRLRVSDISVEDWAYLLAVSLLSPVMMCRLTLHLQAKPGQGDQSHQPWC
jgi:NAD(P)-dependent dehydrogenase (short-subunit alcohol dehydrogenase family)